MQNIGADLEAGIFKQRTSKEKKATQSRQWRAILCRERKKSFFSNSAPMTSGQDCSPLVAFLISAVPTALAAWSFRASRREKRVRFVKGGARAGVVSATRHKTGKGILTFGTHVFRGLTDRTITPRVAWYSVA